MPSSYIPLTTMQKVGLFVFPTFPLIILGTLFMIMYPFNHFEMVALVLACMVVLYLVRISFFLRKRIQTKNRWLLIGSYVFYVFFTFALTCSFIIELLNAFSI